jgi:hypothetical protein
MSDRETPTVRFGTRQFEARASAIRLFVLIAVMVIPIYIAYELAPFLDRDVTISRALNSPAYNKFVEEQALISNNVAH